MLEKFALGVLTGLVCMAAYLGLRELEPAVRANVLFTFGGSITAVVLLAMCAVGRGT